MRNTLYLLIGLIFFAGCFYYFLQKPANVAPLGHSSTITVGARVIKVDVSATEEKREQGLSGKPKLAVDTGMLFVFDTPGKYGFWMKDMNFPIDIIWIDENWIVAGVERGAEPSSYPKVFSPSRDIKYVLEVGVNSGIDTGEKLIFRE